MGCRAAGLQAADSVAGCESVQTAGRPFRCPKASCSCCCWASSACAGALPFVTTDGAAPASVSREAAPGSASPTGIPVAAVEFRRRLDCAVVQKSATAGASAGLTLLPRRCKCSGRIMPPRPCAAQVAGRAPASTEPPISKPVRHSMWGDAHIPVAQQRLCTAELHSVLMY